MLFTLTNGIYQYLLAVVLNALLKVILFKFQNRLGLIRIDEQSTMDVHKCLLTPRGLASCAS
mgnify:FL=1